jgi:hypothetical protein
MSAFEKKKNLRVHIDYGHGAFTAQESKGSV